MSSPRNRLCQLWVRSTTQRRGLPRTQPTRAGFAAASDVGDNPANADPPLNVGVVVALVEAQMVRPLRPASAAQHDRVERLPDHPLVVQVGAGDRRGQGNAPSVGQDVALDAKLGAHGWIGTPSGPPFGAFTIAL